MAAAEGLPLTITVSYSAIGVMAVASPPTKSTAFSARAALQDLPVGRPAAGPGRVEGRGDQPGRDRREDEPRHRGGALDSATRVQNEKRNAEIRWNAMVDVLDELAEMMKRWQG